MSSATDIETTCCIAGGGPAGMMLGFLLARSGVDVVVLEKHADFLRDFRGDTIHPSTLEVMHELGLLEDLLRLPHQEVATLSVWFEGREVRGPDFSRLPTFCKFIALMPQWDLLNFLAEQGRQYATFDLRMKAEVTDLLVEDGRVAGVVAKTAAGELRIRARLVVGTDGRRSTVRRCAGLKSRDFGVPIDVLWFRLTAPANQMESSLGRVQDGNLLVTIPRGDYYQCGFLIRKGTFEEVKSGGLPAFRDLVAKLAPFLSVATHEIADWSAVSLLTVQVDRALSWQREGLLVIGDAAHAMSPAGGVGINYAIQDAVAASNLLTATLRQRKTPSASELQAVQRRREPPVRKMQAIQVYLHRRAFGDRDGQRAITVNRFERLLLSLVGPLLRRAAGRIVGLGFRPEHVATQAAGPLRPAA